MKKIRLLTLLVLGLLLGGTAYAQNRVSGVVKSSEDGQPLAGVVVQIKGTTIGALTGPDGAYTINNASAGNSTLVFSYAGMRKQEVPVAGKSTVNVTMQPDALQAEAVTVTALGVKKQDRKLGYATSTVKGDELARTNSISPANALQGKVAGVQISSGGSGGVTTAPSVTIRGAKSLTKNNSPIYVIDGIIMEYSQQSGNQVWGNSEETRFGNQLKNLNPDDYESMTVLKGAAATSLYGSRGANGAIVITTKTGKARKGVGVEVNYTHEWGDTYRNPVNLQNKYGMGDPGNGYEGGVVPNTQSTSPSGYDSFSFGPSFASMKGQQLYQYYKNYPPTGVDNPLDSYQAYPDNWKTFYQTSQYDNVSVALTGGSDKATYRLSYGFTESKGSMPNNSFDRHSLNFNTNGKINDIFSTNLSVQYSNSNTKNAYYNNGYDWNTSLGYITSAGINRNTDMRWYQDHFINKETYERYGVTALGGANSFINRMTDKNANRNEQTIIAQLGLSAQFNDWLDANVSISYNNFQVFSEDKNYGSSLNRTGGDGYYGISGASSGSYDGIAQLHSNNRFLDDNLELDVRLMGEIYGNTRSTSFSKGTRGGLITPGLWTFSNSKDPLQVSDYGAGMSPRNNMTLGVAGIVNLSWKDQINLEVTGRNDWLSSLLYPTWLPYGADNYSVFYPSVNVSWIFSDTFNINQDVLSFGKLRASWAQVGKGTDPYNTADGAGGYSVGGIYGPQNTSLLSASPNNNALPNYDLKPEIQNSIEFGADLRFLNGRIGLDATYYKTNTRNQILSVNTVSESGVNTRWINAGNVQNQGWELQLDVTPIRSQTVKWDISMNWTRNRGIIKELAEGISDYSISGGVDGSPGVYAFVNGPYGVICAGNGYTGSNPFAVFNNANDPNDYRNGKRLIYYAANMDDNTFTNGAPVNPEFRFLTANNISGYFGDKAAYWGGQKNTTTNFGSVQPDFTYGINTSLRINLPNSSGSLDFYGQIDGRSGGNMVNIVQRYATQGGNTMESLYGRDKENGGVARINFKGETEFNGVAPEAVFWEKNSTVTSIATGQKVDIGGMTYQEAVKAGHIQPMLASTYYRNWYWGRADNYLSKQSFMALRELTIGYNLPQKWVKHVGLQDARLAFTARNICYIYNGLRGKTNPDSYISNNVLTPYDYGTTPFVRTFAMSLNLKF